MSPTLREFHAVAGDRRRAVPHSNDRIGAGAEIRTRDHRLGKAGSDRRSPKPRAPASDKGSDSPHGAPGTLTWSAQEIPRVRRRSRSLEPKGHRIDGRRLRDSEHSVEVAWQLTKTIDSLRELLCERVGSHDQT